jgi:quercetin dioxygenase-like cupin family protein
VSSSNIDLRESFEVTTEFASSAPNPFEIRNMIMRFENELKKFDQEQLPLKHHFADGQYGREIFIPKGTLVVGKIHKHSHLNIVSKGDVTVVTEFGINRIIAPYTFVSQPGTKRALLANEDTIWTTVHVTNETDIEKIEEQIIAPTYSDYDEIAFQRNLQSIAGGGS